MIAADCEQQFCCAGCDAVWQVLHSCGLEEYYRLRDAYQETRPHAARVSGKSFDYLDDPEFVNRHSSGRTKGGVRIEFYLDGVHCVACAWLIEKVLMEKEGAAFAQLDLGKRVVEIIFDPSRVSLSKLARALDRLGYMPHPLAGESASEAARKESRRYAARLGVAAACAGNIMLLAVSLYAGEFSGIDSGYASLFRWISLGLAIPALTYSAWPFYRGAWAGLKHGRLHMDLPISLGIVAAFAVSLIATLLDRGEVYFDSVSMLIALLLAGRFLLMRAGQWASGSAESLLQLEAKTARRVVDNIDEEVSLSDINAGDTLRVLPGETVPVDGVVCGERAWVSQAHLTGEAKPILLDTGDTIYAGAKVMESPVLVLTTAVGETTRIHRLAEFMRESSHRRAPIVNIADRIAGYFTGIVILLAVITGVVWSFVDPSRALWNAAAMLIVTCPCALGLATPIALAMAMGRAARKGIFIKGADGVERLAGVNHVILDKTGTLTYGIPQLRSKCFVRGISEFEAANILSEVAALERQSGQVYSSAFQDITYSQSEISEFRSISGSGIEGRINNNFYRVGSKAFAVDGGALDSDLARFADSMAKAGHARCYVQRNDEIVAALGFEDSPHTEAAGSVRTLKHLGLELEILSGDSQASVGAIARELNIQHYRGDSTPEAKFDRVNELESSGVRVAMVGDGVNDSAALSRATVGISAANAADIAREAADVFISARGPQAISDALKLSRRSMKIVRLNIGIGIAYNIVGAALALMGMVSPLTAAVLMPVSSLTVLIIATKA